RAAHRSRPAARRASPTPVPAAALDVGARRAPPIQLRWPCTWLAPGLAVGLLLGRRLIDRHAECLELQSPNLAVDRGRHLVHAGLELSAADHALLACPDLARERAA